MKIITLVPVKNEGWILDFSLKNYSIFSDEIILLDDGSTDNTKEIALQYENVFCVPYKTEEASVNMSARRNELLRLAREHNGTHLIFLDADEIISTDLAFRLKEILLNEKPGKTVMLPWILVHKGEQGFLYDKSQEENYKDFIFIDDQVSFFENKHLSEDRTPGKKDEVTILSFESGCVYHFQNISEKRNQYKQAWYRCNELIEGSRSPQRINLMYDFTKNLSPKNPSFIKDTFVSQEKKRIAAEAPYQHFLDRITSLFQKKGILFFEPLDIWYLEELRNDFIEKTGKYPVPKTFPKVILFLNTIKNKLKNRL
jgi:glycosyltransferase involved in cell wall biosynthesis